MSCAVHVYSMPLCNTWFHFQGTTTAKVSAVEVQPTTAIEGNATEHSTAAAKEGKTACTCNRFNPRTAEAPFCAESMCSIITCRSGF